MSAGKYKLKVEQGTDLQKWFRKTVAGVPADFTGYTARMQVRENYDSGDVLLELTTENGGLVFDALDGKITLVFTPEMTAGKDWRRAIYDIELTDPSGKVSRFLQGSFCISPEVTHD